MELWLKRVWIAVMAVVVVGGSIGVFAFLRHADRLESEAMKWPTTEGVVLISEPMTNRVRSRVTPPGRRSNKEQAAIRIEPRVRYRYDVEGRTYTNGAVTRVRFGGFETDEAYTARILERFPIGARVTVHFNDQNPAESVLLPRYDAP